MGVRPRCCPQGEDAVPLDRCVKLGSFAGGEAGGWMYPLSSGRRCQRGAPRALPKMLSSTKEEQSKVRGRDCTAAWLEGEVADGVFCGQGQKDARGEENAHPGNHGEVPAESFLVRQFSAAMGKGINPSRPSPIGNTAPLPVSC